MAEGDAASESFPNSSTAKQPCSVFSSPLRLLRLISVPYMARLSLTSAGHNLSANRHAGGSFSDILARSRIDPTHVIDGLCRCCCWKIMNTKTKQKR